MVLSVKKVVVFVSSLLCASVYAQASREIVIDRLLIEQADFIEKYNVLCAQGIAPECVFEQLMQAPQEQAYSFMAKVGNLFGDFGDIVAWFSFVSLFYGFWYMVDPEILKAMCDEDILQQQTGELS